MNTNNSKRIYTAPQIGQVKLDNDISLILASAPPAGPDEETASFVPEQFDPKPY